MQAQPKRLRRAADRSWPYERSQGVGPRLVSYLETEVTNSVERWKKKARDSIGEKGIPKNRRAKRAMRNGDRAKAAQLLVQTCIRMGFVSREEMGYPAR